MTLPETVLNVLQSYGLLLLFPLAVIEGPIVTVIAAYLASLGYLNIFAVFAAVVVADLIGDSILYSLGRFGTDVIPKRWMLRLPIKPSRLAEVAAQFQARGGKILIVAKLTHAAGFIVLFAAGVSRMPFLSFVWYNFVATLPKSLFLAAIGYTIGYAYNEIESYILRVSIVVLVAAGALGLYWVARAQRRWV